MSKNISEEELSPCVICKKVWRRKDTAEYVYHESRGIVCRRHPGVMQWHNELLAAMNAQLKLG